MDQKPGKCHYCGGQVSGGKCRGCGRLRPDVSRELTDAELEDVAAGKVGPSGVLFPNVGWPGWFRPRDRWPLVAK